MIGPVRILTALAAMAAVAFAAYLHAPMERATADIRGSEYSLEVAIGESGVAVGGQFAAYVGVYHAAGSYQAVQWYLDYNPAVVDVVAISKDPAAPGACAHTADNGDRVLLGCVDLGGANISHSGNAWIIGFKCVGNGTAAIDLTTSDSNGGTAVSFVSDGGANKPVHTHSDSVQCGVGGTPPPPPPLSGDACTVASVITGDTFTCTDGKTVRMLQIDAQDLTQCGGEWAKAALQYIFLTPGRVVTLTYDAKKTDGQGRTLAAPVWRGNDGADYNLSIVMVYVGLAKAADLGDGNVKFLDWAKAAETWARVAQWNMWAPNKTYTGGCD